MTVEEQSGAPSIAQFTVRWVGWRRSYGSHEHPPIAKAAMDGAPGIQLCRSIGFAQAAWRPPRIGYMPLDEVQSLAGIYGLQESVSSDVTHLLLAQAEAMGPVIVEEPDFKHMPAAQFEQMRHAGARNFADVVILQQLLKELDQQYTHAVKQK